MEGRHDVVDGPNPGGVDCRCRHAQGATPPASMGTRFDAAHPVQCIPANRVRANRRARVAVPMSDAARTGSLEVALAHAERLLQTDPALAAEQAGEILRTVGDHPAAW